MTVGGGDADAGGESSGLVAVGDGGSDPVGNTSVATTAASTRLAATPATRAGLNAGIRLTGGLVRTGPGSGCPGGGEIGVGNAIGADPVESVSCRDGAVAARSSPRTGEDDSATIAGAMQ